MIRIALDSNILIYAELELESDKGTHSIDLILQPPAMVSFRRRGSGNISASSNGARRRPSSRRSDRYWFMKLLFSFRRQRPL
jgi:hypothetical protein